MGTAIMTTNESPDSFWKVVFNTPLESGMRTAALLLAAFPRACDIQRLVQYDYLIVHSGDVEGGPPSIHPATPHRSGELLVRRSLVEAGIDLMVRRSVVERAFTDQGIGFVAGSYAVVFLDSLSSDYSKNLRLRARWVIDRFQEMSDDDLAAYLRARWSQWGAEFMHAPLMHEHEE